MTKLKLTEDQENAVSGILRDIKRKGARPVLCGYAGTGKTVTTAALVSRLSGLGMSVVVATPTHKARFQVERALRNNGVFMFQSSTVHKLLGLKMVRNYETGVETFDPDPKGNNVLDPKGGDKVDIVVVDETSMVSSRLYSLLTKVMGNRPIVFVGDDRQLLPVGEESVCRAFTEATSTYRLTDVLRHDGAILNLATVTREKGEGRSSFSSSEGGGSVVIACSSYSEWRREMLKEMVSEMSLQDPDHCRVLAWTNSAVNQMNSLIHKSRYGDDAPAYVPGMTCVTVESVPDPNGKAPLLNSTVDVRIISAVFQTRRFPGDDYSDPLWNVWALRIRPTGEDSSTFDVLVLDKEEEKRWQKAQKELASRAKSAKMGKERSELWKTYFRRQDSIAKLEPASALTIHKSQGSTFKKVFLHPSIDWVESPDVQNQLTYVGITRAAEALFVVKG